MSRARDALARTGWVTEQTAERSLDDALKNGSTHIGADVDALIAHPGIEIIVEVTGNPSAAVSHVLKAFANKKHVVNVTARPMPFVDRCMRVARPKPAWSTASPMATSRR